MKRNWKLLLSMGILLFAANLTEKEVWAQEIHIEEEIYINPVYEDVMEETDLISKESVNLSLASELF